MLVYAVYDNDYSEVKRLVEAGYLPNESFDNVGSFLSFMKIGWSICFIYFIVRIGQTSQRFILQRARIPRTTFFRYSYRLTQLRSILRETLKGNIFSSGQRYITQLMLMPLKMYKVWSTMERPWLPWTTEMKRLCKWPSVKIIEKKLKRFC